MKLTTGLILSISFFLTGCITSSVQEDSSIQDYRSGINDYSPAPSWPKSTANMSKPMRTLAQDTSYSFAESEEERIERLATHYIAEKKWKSALKILSQYEPVFNYSEKLVEQLISVSLKLEQHPLASHHLRLLMQDADTDQKRLERQKLLAHTYYLSKDFDNATTVYQDLLQQHNYTEAADKLFLISYQKKDLAKMEEYLSLLDASHPQFVYFSILLSDMELESDKTDEAFKRIQDMYVKKENFSDRELITLQYARMLVQTEQYGTALKLLDAQKNYLTTEARQFHFMKAYIYFQQGNKEGFRQQLAFLDLEDEYKNDLTRLFLDKKNYLQVYYKVFQKEELDDYRVQEAVRGSIDKYIASTFEQSRLPASLEAGPENPEAQ